jgi:hypothetical protein
MSLTARRLSYWLTEAQSCRTWAAKYLAGGEYQLSRAFAAEMAKCNRKAKGYAAALIDTSNRVWID